MQIYHLKDMRGGWFIGDFSPTVYQTDLFEVSVKHYRQNELHDVHFHKIAVEINVLVRGKILIQNRTLEAGQIFVIEPHEIADIVFLEESTIVCVKMPSVIDDKYIIN